MIAGGPGAPMLSGEWERAPEVRMAPSLRELVEETVRNQMLQFPDAILQATRESDGPQESQEIRIDSMALTKALGELGFRPAHVKASIVFLQDAAKRIKDGRKDGEGLDPLV